MEISPIASTVVAQGQKNAVQNAVLQLVVQPWARLILASATEASGAQPLHHMSFGGREGMRGVLERAVLEGRRASIMGVNVDGSLHGTDYKQSSALAA